MSRSELDAARDEIAAVGRMLSTAGLSPGTTGNLSVRVGEAIVCTPTGSRLSSLDPEDLSVIALDGSRMSGPTATKETFMHRAMYAADASFTAVVHLHSPFATAVSCLRTTDPEDAIPPMTPYLAMRAGKVRLIPYFPPGDAGVTDPIIHAVSEGGSAILLGNHGSLIGGATLSDAASTAQELEEAARLQLITDGMPVRYLSDDERAALQIRRP